MPASRLASSCRPFLFCRLSLSIAAVVLTVLCGSLALPDGAMAAQPAAQKAALSVEAQADVQAAEDYLNSLRTIKSRFVQTDNGGHQSAGDFLLKRPGRMRFEYDAPVNDFIVADGTFVHYYDAKMQQQSSAPISRTLANFFLQPDIKISGDIAVDDVRRAQDGTLLIITVSQAKDPLSGNLSLGFDRDPKTGRLTLRRWQVVDPQGLITEITLTGVKTGISLDNNLFHYYDPKRTKPRYN